MLSSLNEVLIEVPEIVLTLLIYLCFAPVAPLACSPRSLRGVWRLSKAQYYLQYFFNETQARYIISVNPLKEKQVTSFANEKNIPLTKLGIASGLNLCFGSEILGLAHVNDLYQNVISNMMDKESRLH